ncbi:hypothetical protein PIB30_055060 [Stylosanthes scabra]|uniref:Uncharacterized protein n=1 Tax=Stylosanthes scabra TaxID=79078 RepID=A0ABU6XJ62_9FABA|nr:hypothetical protein [Stylosanthes scabra]
MKVEQLLASITTSDELCLQSPKTRKLFYKEEEKNKHSNIIHVFNCHVTTSSILPPSLQAPPEESNDLFEAAFEEQEDSPPESPADTSVEAQQNSNSSITPHNSQSHP